MSWIRVVNYIIATLTLIIYLGATGMLAVIGGTFLVFLAYTVPAILVIIFFFIFSGRRRCSLTSQTVVTYVYALLIQIEMFIVFAGLVYVVVIMLMLDGIAISDAHMMSTINENITTILAIVASYLGFRILALGFLLEFLTTCEDPQKLLLMDYEGIHY